MKGDAPAEPARAGGLARAHARVRGRVQGVNYRAATRGEAQRLGLSGWVRNMDDGSVEVLAEGPRPAVETLLDWCRRGPPFASVESMEVDWEEHRGDLARFAILR